MKRTVTVALALAFAVGLPAQSAKRPMTLDDGFRMVNVGGGQISPDGRWALYSRATRDFATDSSKTTWWLAPTDASTPARQFIGEAGAANMIWAPDSRTLYFLRPVNKVRQLHSMSLDGGEALALTEFKENEGNWTLDPSGKFFVIRRSEKDSVLEKKKKDGWDHVYVDEGSNGQSAESWSNLWTFDLASKKLTRLTQRDWAIGAMDVSSDGKRIVLSARADNKRNTGGAAELYLIDIASKGITQLTDNKGPESGPAWAPDNHTIVFEAVSLDKWDSGNGDFFTIDADTKAIKKITQPHAGQIGNPVFTPDGKYIYFAGGYGTARWPRRLDMASGKMDELASTKGLIGVSSWSKDRTKYLYSYQDFNTPADLYVGTVGKTADRQVQVTDANPWVRDSIAMGKVEVVQWKSVKDFTIEGLVHTPAGYDPAAKKPIPLILNIHGGPAGAWTNNFSTIAHVYNGLGYALISPNVRGSVGYDDKLMRGNMGDIGGGDYQDVMTGVDAMIARGLTVPDSISLRGWSYGGILGGWTITQTTRFKAASLGAMVSDWTSEYGPGFNFDVSLWYIGGDPWTNAQAFREKSSLTYVNKVKTPTLLLHGDNDITDTPAQSMNFFAGLQKFNVPSRYVRFPNEPHGFGKLKHQRVRDTEEIQWMQKYVRGLKDYAYPDVPSEKKKLAAAIP
ncbi:MAG: S9 family peptidase [Gemmatimonadetes bacterium]|nr:S9 family peptidase [Gemmatimonadota bacterium]